MEPQLLCLVFDATGEIFARQAGERLAPSRALEISGPAGKSAGQREVGGSSMSRSPGAGELVSSSTSTRRPPI